MTRADRIDEALQLLKVRDLPSAEQAKWRLQIERGLAGMVEPGIYADIWKFEHSKDINRALDTYNRAARKLKDADRRLRAAITKQGLSIYPGKFKDLIEPAVIERAIEVSTPSKPAPSIKAEPKPMNRAARTPKDEEMNPFEAYGAETASTRWDKEKAAVALAQGLLKRRGLKIVTTKGGTWWKLAVILLGRDTDLYQHLRQYARDQKKPGHI
jgi:hypothetical protein